MKKIKIRCPKCGHSWETKSTLRLVSCPSCLQKVPNPRYATNQEVLMEHFNLGEDGVRVLDPNVNRKGTKWICDVHFKEGKVWCEYCESEDCRHVKFALNLPEVQKILKKKGWEINPS